MISLTAVPAENGAAKATVGPFKDEDNQTVVPSAVSWSLSKTDGSIVNSRHNVTLTPAGTISWLISASDLAVTDSNNTGRIITVSFTYSSTLGGDVTSRVQAMFNIEDFGVSS